MEERIKKLIDLSKHDEITDLCLDLLLEMPNKDGAVFFYIEDKLFGKLMQYGYSIDLINEIFPNNFLIIKDYKFLI